MYMHIVHAVTCTCTCSYSVQVTQCMRTYTSTNLSNSKPAVEVRSASFPTISTNMSGLRRHRCLSTCSTLCSGTSKSDTVR